MIRGFFIAMAFLSSCAIEVGNPHPEPVGKSSIHVTLSADDELNVDQLNLNVSGIKLIRSDANSQNIAFSTQQRISMRSGTESDRISIYKGTTLLTGSYAKVRVYFDREEFGNVIYQNTIYDLTLTQGSSFIDIPLTFALRQGSLTRISLTFTPRSILLEVVDETGQVTSYQMSTEFGAQADQETITTIEDSFETAYKSFRVAVRSTNASKTFRMRKLKFLINGAWQKAELNPDSVKNNTYAIAGTTVSMAASSNSDIAWMVFDDANAFPVVYQSKEAYDENTGEHALGSYEHVQFNFAKPIVVQGFEFSGMGDKRCATGYELQGTKDGMNWEVIPGSSASLEACELVNVNW